MYPNSTLLVSILIKYRIHNNRDFLCVYKDLFY